MNCSAQIGEIMSEKKLFSIKKVKKNKKIVLFANEL
jgi:hypothetical protein